MDNSITFGSIFVLGALHALEPGHGKSFLASFSLAKNFNWKHLISLVTGLLISHFFMLAIISILLKYLSGQLEENLLSWFEWFGPLAVITFGIFLFIKYKKERQSGTCSCGKHHHEQHHHPESLKKTTVAGLIGGLIPCPTAITPLIFSGVDAHFGHVISYLLIYVAGMCITMLGIIGLIYASKQTFTRYFDGLGKKFNINLVSAGLIILIGLSYFVVKVIDLSQHAHG